MWDIKIDSCSNINFVTCAWNCSYKLTNSETKGDTATQGPSIIQGEQVSTVNDFVVYTIPGTGGGGGGGGGLGPLK